MESDSRLFATKEGEGATLNTKKFPRDPSSITYLLNIQLACWVF